MGGWLDHRASVDSLKSLLLVPESKHDSLVTQSVAQAPHRLHYLDSHLSIVPNLIMRESLALLSHNFCGVVLKHTNF
jgi:hypothetical protein